MHVFILLTQALATAVWSVLKAKRRLLKVLDLHYTSYNYNFI